MKTFYWCTEQFWAACCAGRFDKKLKRAYSRGYALFIGTKMSRLSPFDNELKRASQPKPIPVFERNSTLARLHVYHSRICELLKVRVLRETLQGLSLKIMRYFK